LIGNPQPTTIQESDKGKNPEDLSSKEERTTKPKNKSNSVVVLKAPVKREAASIGF